MACGQINQATNNTESTLIIEPMDTSRNTKELLVDLTILDENFIEITVTNISEKIVRAYSHVLADELHYDYFEVEAITPDYEHLYFSFYADREKSAPIIVELQPQESFTHKIDLLSWANSSTNKATLETIGFQQLSSFRSFKLRAKYRNSPCQDCNAYYKSIWSGYCYSEWKNG